MTPLHRDRLLDADGELSQTLGWILKSGNVPAAEEARVRIAQLSTELREKYALAEPPRDEQADEFHRLMDSGMHARWGYVPPRVLRHYEDRHFTMIRGVGREYAGHIRWLLKESGIGREPDVERGLYATRIRSLKTSPERLHRWCPDDMEETTLGALRGLTMAEILDRFVVDGESEERYVRHVLERYAKA